MSATPPHPSTSPVKPQTGSELGESPLTASDAGRSSAQAADTAQHDGHLTVTAQVSAALEAEDFSTLALPLGAPAQTEPPQYSEADQDESYQEPSQPDLLPPPDFKPFFTLIEDPDAGSHVHPEVHYLFAGDDQEVLTNAALAVMDAENGGDADTLQEEERVIILDVSADGKSVVSATSLSPRWQSLKTDITQAPSWGSDPAPTNRGSMLRISGRSARAVVGDARGGNSNDEFEALIERFSENLGGLDEIMGRDPDGHEA